MGNPVNMYYIGSELLTHYNANVHNFHLETNEMWNFEERFSIINQYSVFSLKTSTVFLILHSHCVTVFYTLEIKSKFYLCVLKWNLSHKRGRDSSTKQK